MFSPNIHFFVTGKNQHLITTKKILLINMRVSKALFTVSIGMWIFYEI